jgi:hypothetical protein
MIKTKYGVITRTPDGVLQFISDELDRSGRLAPRLYLTLAEAQAFVDQATAFGPLQIVPVTI